MNNQRIRLLEGLLDTIEEGVDEMDVQADHLAEMYLSSVYKALDDARRVLEKELNGE